MRITIVKKVSVTFKTGKARCTFGNFTINIFFPLFFFSSFSYDNAVFIPPLVFNLFGPKGDQYQFSPNNIRSSRVKVMRITLLITKEITL